MSSDARKNLIKILKSAYSGELAAAYAYRGHWKSVSAPDEKICIRQIEEEEWEHRECVLGWLRKLEAEPSRIRELVFWSIGRNLGILCFISGWFFPMYFAGRLESQNTKEYEDAANFAKELGLQECVMDMLKMSAKELEHEKFFRRMFADHRLLRVTKRIFSWS